MSELIGRLTDIAGHRQNVLVGPETSDDAGVYRLGDVGLVATADFITPVCDDPKRFGWVAAANALSDVYAMGGTPLFALNLCAFPEVGLPDGVARSILEGAAHALNAAGAALIGGHSVKDADLKYGLAVVGTVAPDRILKNAGARPGDVLVLTKPLGTGLLINAFRKSKIDEAALEPALVQMERLNRDASRLALSHGAAGATDVTGFGLAGHALEIARASKCVLEIDVAALPVYEKFAECFAAGVSTGCTGPNMAFVAPHRVGGRSLSPVEESLLHDPQTSGGLLICVAPDRAGDLLKELKSGGHDAALIGRVKASSPDAGLTFV